MEAPPPLEDVPSSMPADTLQEELPAPQSGDMDPARAAEVRQQAYNAPIRVTDDSPINLRDDEPDDPPALQEPEEEKQPMEAPPPLEDVPSMPADTLQDELPAPQTGVADPARATEISEQQPQIQDVWHEGAWTQRRVPPRQRAPRQSAPQPSAAPEFASPPPLEAADVPPRASAMTGVSGPAVDMDLSIPPPQSGKMDPARAAQFRRQAYNAPIKVTDTSAINLRDEDDTPGPEGAAADMPGLEGPAVDMPGLEGPADTPPPGACDTDWFI